MLQPLFLWFYCLSITNAVLLIIIISAAYLILRRWLQKKRFWRAVIVLLFLVWFAVIIVATLTGRTFGIAHAEPQLIPFHSFRAVMAGGNPEILRSNFMNVALFYPAGLLACELLPKGWSRVGRAILITVSFALMSAGIEFWQYYYALGQAEVDDVLHNALGAIIGAMVCTIQIKWEHRTIKD